MKKIKTFEYFVNENYSIDEAAYYGDYKKVVTKVYTKANNGGYSPQNDQENLAYALRKLGIDKDITIPKLIKDPKFTELSQEHQEQIQLANGTGKSPNAAFVKAYVAALKNFGTQKPDHSDEARNLTEMISDASVLKKELEDNSYPSSYIGLTYQDSKSLKTQFGSSYETLKKLNPEEKKFVQLAAKKHYENFVKRTLTNQNFEKLIKAELKWEFRNKDNNDAARFAGISWTQESLKPLFDFIVSIITGDHHNPKWETFKVSDLKMLDSKHSAVVSSSFSTTYYYSAKVEFEGKPFVIPSFVMGSDHYSGGWN